MLSNQKNNQFYSSINRGALLKETGLTAHAGPATGYVLRFSNGLVVYLSGDTGLTAEQKVVVGEHYKATRVPVPPLSGKTIAFNGNAGCVSGC